MDLFTLSETEWRKRLSAEAYHILREAGTEPAFSGRYDNNTADGLYRCNGCVSPLFDSADKYRSDSGWPSFSKPTTPERLSEHSDASHGGVRTEVRCARCDGHLGHVFPDDLSPTDLRYCINSLSLDFRARESVGSDEPKG